MRGRMTRSVMRPRITPPAYPTSRVLFDQNFVPPLFARAGLQAVHLGPGTLERLGDVPRFPGGAILPGADDDSLVQRLSGHGQLQPDPPGLRLRGVGSFAKRRVPNRLATGL